MTRFVAFDDPVDRPLREGIVRYLLEADEDGGIVKELGLDATGRVVHRYDKRTAGWRTGVLSHDINVLVPGVERRNEYYLTLEELGGAWLIDRAEFEKLWAHAG